MVGLLNSSTLREQYAGKDVVAALSKSSVVNQYTNVEERIRSIMSFLKDVTTATEELVND